jgi:DNA invertase Pin-like site-specific DNA recombinase
LKALLSDARSRRFDVVVVWTLDRLARSLRQLLNIADEWQQLGVDFVAYKQDINTNSPGGRLVFSVLGAVGEFERSIISQRVKAGIQNALAEGKRIGRPPKRILSETEIEHIKTASRKGTSVRKLAGRYNTSQWMIAKLVNGVTA